MANVVPSLAGPKRPQDRVLLSGAKAAFRHELKITFNANESTKSTVEGTDYCLHHGDLVIAAITSCTNTSNLFLITDHFQL